MPQKDVRKILKIGKSSLAVALPKGWFRYNNLKPGDSVEVITDHAIEIRPIESTKSG